MKTYPVWAINLLTYQLLYLIRRVYQNRHMISICEYRLHNKTGIHNTI